MGKMGFLLIMLGILAPGLAHPITNEPTQPVDTQYPKFQFQQRNQGPIFMYPVPNYPSSVSSVYTFPAPNPAMFFQQVVPYQQLQGPRPGVTTPLHEVERMDRTSTGRTVTQQFNISTGTYNIAIESEPDDEDDQYASPILVNRAPSHETFSAYPMHFTVPVLPNVAPMQIQFQSSPLLMMPMVNLVNYYSVPMVPVSTMSTLLDLGTLSAPAPEIGSSTTELQTDAKEQTSIPEIIDPVTEEPTPVPSILTPVADGIIPVPAAILTSVTEQPTLISSLLAVIEEPTTPVPSILTVIKESATPQENSSSIAKILPEKASPVTETPYSVTDDPPPTSVKPKSYAELDYSSLPIYFNKIYSYSSTYASSYSNYIPIITYKDNRTSSGYEVQFETANGIKSKEEGHLKVIKIENQGNEDHSQARSVRVKSGQVIWTSPECIKFALKYVADENGYRPEITQSLEEGCSLYGEVNNNGIELLNSAPQSS